MREIKIESSEKGQRVDKFLFKYMKLAPKSFVYKMLRKKNIKLNGKRAEGSEILKEGDILNLYLADETIEKFTERADIKKAGRDFEIVYEDENIIICGKPEGLIVHPDKEHRDNTLNDQLLWYLYEKGEYKPVSSKGFVPSICNRLDLNTSGIVTMGKNLASVQELNRGFRERFIDKYYLTVVKGVVAKEGKVEGYHLKNEGNIALISNKDNGGDYICTKYKPLKSNGEYTLLEVKLETGKSHQIRVCMEYIGHPIIGDRKYGDSKVNKYFYDKYSLERQFLHSCRLKLNMDKGCLEYLKGREFICNIKGCLQKIYNDLFQ